MLFKKAKNVRNLYVYFLIKLYRKFNLLKEIWSNKVKKN